MKRNSGAWPVLGCGLFACGLALVTFGFAGFALAFLALFFGAMGTLIGLEIHRPE